MAFDFGTWIISYSLSSIAQNTIEKANVESFSNDLNSIVIDWAENLPNGLYVDPESIFPTPSTLDERNNKSLEILREKIITKELPSFKDWTTAILEQWKIIKTKLGESAQSFYLIDEIEALSYIDKLSYSLYQRSRLNTELFKNKVLNELELIKIKIDSLKPKESIQNIINSKLSIINELKNSITIINSFWPLNPMFTRYDDDYSILHKIVENVCLNIHFSYGLILPYSDRTEITPYVQKTKNDLIASLNNYLEAVDKFYVDDMEAAVKLLDDDNPIFDVGNNISKWMGNLILIKEYLKIELETE